MPPRYPISLRASCYSERGTFATGPTLGRHTARDPVGTYGCFPRTVLGAHPRAAQRQEPSTIGEDPRRDSPKVELFRGRSTRKGDHLDNNGAHPLRLAAGLAASSLLSAAKGYYRAVVVLSRRCLRGDHRGPRCGCLTDQRDRDRDPVRWGHR